ncbi:uncharacterized protein RSE6_15094 [Rhynchosporium secalis]|uniref:Uncharacterized protein n=1 Tax=Rhynchosporium secalis TaxID=38038 RepID=A0A1E1MWN8_RHYSE|nr:uncharacterized protein RSE6_15094 [Rhynchosporium secalis]
MLSSKKATNLSLATTLKASATSAPKTNSRLVKSLIDRLFPLSTTKASPPSYNTLIKKSSSFIPAIAKSKDINYNMRISL